MAIVDEENRKLTGEPKRFPNGFRWEMDETGNHRLVAPDGTSSGWTSYASPAIHADHIIFTAYYSVTLAEKMDKPDGLPFAEELYELRVVA